MDGSVRYRKDRDIYFVLWKGHKIYRYMGMPIGNRKDIAESLLAQMRGDVDRGFFDIEKYKNPKWSSTLDLLSTWKKEIVDKKGSPGTISARNSYIKNWIRPFFEENRVGVNEIQYDLLLKLKNRIADAGRAPIYQFNIMQTLKQFLKYAVKCRKISFIPPFPEAELYNIKKRKKVKWLPSDRQMKILSFIPDEHKPFFMFLKYTMRRPGEACAIQRNDIIYEDGEIVGFNIRRGISAGKLVDHTKTHKEHEIPCHDDLIPYIKQALKNPIISPRSILFKCKEAENEFKRYTPKIYLKIWKKACKLAGEDIPCYSGTKHSTCCQYINEKGLNKFQLQALTDHKSLESLDYYTTTEIAEKKRLLMTTPLKPETKKKEAN